MRRTDYVTRMEERRYTVQEMVCDNCGTVAQLERALDRPEGWATIYRAIEGAHLSWDFCEWTCLYGFVTANDDDGPGTLLAQLNASVEAVKREKEGIA